MKETFISEKEKIACNAMKVEQHKCCNFAQYYTVSDVIPVLDNGIQSFCAVPPKALCFHKRLVTLFLYSDILNTRITSGSLSEF